MTGLLVALAGGLGAAARFWVDAAVTRHNPTRFPVGTLLINVSGSLLLGLLTGWVLFHGGLGDAAAVAGTGFLGGYTTFSTASVEAFRLARSERRRAAAAYAAGTMVASVGAAVVGLWLAAVAPSPPGL